MVSGYYVNKAVGIPGNGEYQARAERASTGAGLTHSVLRRRGSVLRCCGREPQLQVKLSMLNWRLTPASATVVGRRLWPHIPQLTMWGTSLVESRLP